MKRKLLVFYVTLLLCCSQKTIAQYANTTLSNLTPPVAVNTHLTPMLDSAVDIGSITNNWKTIYFKGQMFIGNTHVFQVQTNNPNTYVGWNAGPSIDQSFNTYTRFGNTGIGFTALQNNLKGTLNTAVGAYALSQGGTIPFGIAFQSNTAIGAYALYKNESQDNVAIGSYSLYSNNTGALNVAVGSEALLDNTTGMSNTGIGYQSLYLNKTGNYNVSIGRESMFYNEDGSANIAIGFQSLYVNKSGMHNIAMGYRSLSSNLGNGNIAFGFNSLSGNVNGSNNIAIGYNTSSYGSSGDYNVALGNNSLVANEASNNVAIGSSVLYNNQSGNENTAVGANSLYLNNGQGNTALGFNTLYSNKTGNNNLALGYSVLYNNNDGQNNIGVGYKSLYTNHNGSYNVGIGWAALYNNNENAYNVGIGLQAGYHSASRATFLGTYADAFDGAYNVTAVGYGAQATSNNQVKIGNPEVTSIGGYANWTNFSDGRYKKNIKENVPGLEFINQLKPVTYTLDVDGIENAISKANPSASPSTALNQIQPSESSSISKQNNNSTLDVPKREISAQESAARQAKAKVVYTGFVAQDVEKAAKAVNYDFSGVDVPKNKNDFYGLRYSDFVIPLVKAVQELSQKTDQIEELKKQNEALAQKNDQLEQRLSKLENLLNMNTSSQNVTISSAYISQNEPNPFNGGTRIRYYIPGNFSNARVDFTDNLGKVIKSVSIQSSTGIISLDASILSSGTYQYTLVVDGRMIDTKRMAVSK